MNKTAKPTIKPDFTAWFVMQCVIATMHQPQFRDPADTDALPFYLPLSCAAAKTRPISYIISLLPYGLQYKIGQLVTNKSRPRHFLFRKKEISTQARTALDAGATQVIVLGAGLDILSMRLAIAYPNARFIEIDTGASQQFKIQALAQANIATPANLERIEGDLRNPLAGILAASTLFDKNAKTVWIAEGFMMFVPEESVRRIFSEIKNLSASGSQIIFTTLASKKTSGAFGQLMQNIYLTKEHCPFEWSASASEVQSLLNSLGYQMAYQLTCAALHKKLMGAKFDGIQQFVEDIHIAVS